jgi:transposase
MPAPLAMDLRVRVMGDLESGMTVPAVAEKYHVSTRTVFNWKSLQKANGSCRPRCGRTGPKPKLTDDRERILATVAEEPSLTLVELRDRLNLAVSVKTLWLALRNWNIVWKKSTAGGRTEPSGRRGKASLVGHSHDAEVGRKTRIPR